MIQIRYSLFDTTALAARLAQLYGFSTVTCRFFKNGLNDVYILQADGKTCYCRVSLAGVHSHAEIVEEIQFVLRLQEAGVSVVRPMPTTDGNYVIPLTAPEGERFAVLFAEVPNCPGGEATNRLRHIGRLLAQVHTAADNLSPSFPLRARPSLHDNLLVDNPIRLLTPHMGKRPDKMEQICRTAPLFWEKVLSLLPMETPCYGICHGDFQPNNFYFQGETPAVFDFDCMGYGYRAYDLGVLLANLSFGDTEIHEKDPWKTILDGYNEIRTLTENESTAIYPLAALHMLRILAYHVEITSQSQGVVYFTSDGHLDTFTDAYLRLAALAKTKCSME